MVEKKDVLNCDLSVQQMVDQTAGVTVSNLVELKDVKWAVASVERLAVLSADRMDACSADLSAAAWVDAWVDKKDCEKVAQTAGLTAQDPTICGFCC